MPNSYDFSWENNFCSKRSDGRHISTLASTMARIRDMKPALEFLTEFDKEQFQNWKSKVKNKLHELMCFPEFTEQPAPVMIKVVNRDGYQVQHWEFFPDDWSVVPVLMLVPDGISCDNKAPGVLCFPGSASSKEFLAGESLLDHPNCQRAKFPERNAMAQHYVKAGMVAVAFDNPGTAELAEFMPKNVASQWGTRTKLSGELLNAGHNYPGLSVFQKICFLKWFKKLDFIDKSKIAVSGHSLGSEPAMILGVLDDDISAVVFNDFVCDPRLREVAMTDLMIDEIRDVNGNWHHVPEMWKWFGFPDLLAALAPKPLTLNEGGVHEHIELVNTAYKLFDATDNLNVKQYPKFADSQNEHTLEETLPAYGLSALDYMEHARVDVQDHSFRPEASLTFLKKHFGV